ncbi:hypothetical protein EV175_005810 [Coemansia sp. RSA 1933]|nr:hypothetical protein EV175_005810 [Coemansia sp. RSA 1933]
MAIQVLRGNTYRGIIHDFESLFYVILHSVSGAYSRIGDAEPEGFEFVNSSNMASVRVAYLGDESHFYEYFGADQCGEGVRKVLKAMRDFLFTKDGQYIGHLLLRKEAYEHKLSSKHARLFMPVDALKLLFPDSISDSAGASSGMTPKKRKIVCGDDNDTEM